MSQHELIFFIFFHFHCTTGVAVKNLTHFLKYVDDDAESYEEDDEDAK